MLDREQLAKVEPALAEAKDKLVGGLHLPNDETGDCYLFTNAWPITPKAWAYNSSLTSMLKTAI